MEESDVKGYYLLKAGDGQGNEMSVGGYLHLNAGGEYLVISESMYGGQWFPDYYGGVEKGEDEEPVLDDSGFVIPLNPVTRYWAFVELDDVPAFSLKVQLYALLQDIEDNYLADETFKAKVKTERVFAFFPLRQSCDEGEAPFSSWASPGQEKGRWSH